MTDILVTSPYQPFTLPTQFKAVFNGYIYCGTVDAVDPSVSQVQVYLVNESGDRVPAAQPLRTNAGGLLVYNGQPAKFVTDSNHSLLVRDSLGAQLWYEPDVAKIDPDTAIKFLLSRTVIQFDSISSAKDDSSISIGDMISVDNYHINGNSGVLFFKVVAAGTGVEDGGKYINTVNGLQLSQNLRLPMSPSAWGAKADGTDDSPAINSMISYFKSTLPTPPANKNYDAKGKGLDFSGRTYSLAATADFSGIDNLSLYNPSFVGLAGFVGTELAKFSSLDPTWYVENTTLWNPYFDCNWNVDFGFDAADFLNLKVFGGKITHYRKKGFRTRRINVGPHEVNMTGTFIFQREYNETFPVDIAEGEAFEIDNFDNNFTNIVVGYQKKWSFTLASGANMFSNCHIYSGVESWPESGVRSLDNSDDFDGCYFDSVPLYLRNRSSVSDCYFVIEGTKDYAIELTTTDPYQIRITGNRFRKNGGASVAAIKMKTIAEGRVNRPLIYDNTADGCTVIQTKGPHPVNISATSTTFALPDQYQPLSSLGPVYLAAGADGLFQERMFGQAYNSTTKQVTVNCYAVSGGSMASSNLGGKQALINFNQ